MIRKIALELVLLGFLLYSLFAIREVLTSYDPLADAAGSVATVGRSMTGLPTDEYRPTGGRDIFEMNLFNPSRVGVVPPPPAPAPVEPEPITEVPPPPPEPMPAVVLKGILEDPSGERIVLVSVDNARSQPYRVGDVFRDFEVLEIGILDAKLSWKGQPVELTLRGQNTPERPEPEPQAPSRRRR